MKFPDRHAPWIMAIVVGLMTYQPMPSTGQGATAAGLMMALAGATLGFISGLPFWLRGRRRGKASPPNQLRS